MENDEREITDRKLSMDKDDEYDSENRNVPTFDLRVPRIPVEFGNQRLLICLETALQRIHLVQIIPHLCAKIVAGDDASLEGILGSVCIETILKLFLTQMVWFESKKMSLSKEGVDEKETDQQLLDGIKNSLTLSSGLEQPVCTDNAVTREGIKRSVDAYKSLSSDGLGLYMLTWPHWGNKGLSVVSQVGEGQLVLYDQDVIGGQCAPNASLILDNMRRLYSQLLHKLESNKRFLVWVQENATEIRHDYAPRKTTQVDRRLLASFTGFQVSDGFLEFKRCMHKLYDVMRRRLLLTFEESVKSFNRSREFWKRERVYKEEAKRLQIKLEKLQLNWNSELREYDDEIAALQLNCNRMIQAEFLQCRDMVEKFAIDNLMKKKTEELKGMERQAIIVELERGQVRLETQHKNEKCKLKANRKILEDRLSKIIATYDSNMMERQRQLDDLQNQERMNAAKIEALKHMLQDTQEQFEEMRNTKKLKEILRNIAMADNFRENRAARIIQMAWRRYKYRKLRKLRRKGKFKRKPKSEEIWKQLGFMTYCTPQDHVRALQQKKAESGNQKQKNKKSKKPFNVHTGSSFRSRQSSSISLFLL